MRWTRECHTLLWAPFMYKRHTSQVFSNMMNASKTAISCDKYRWHHAVVLMDIIYQDTMESFIVQLQLCGLKTLKNHMLQVSWCYLQVNTVVHPSIITVRLITHNKTTITPQPPALTLSGYWIRSCVRSLSLPWQQSTSRCRLLH